MFGPTGYALAQCGVSEITDTGLARVDCDDDQLRNDVVFSEKLGHRVRVTKV